MNLTCNFSIKRKLDLLNPFHVDLNLCQMFEIYYWIVYVKIKQLWWKFKILNIFNIMDFYLQRCKCFNQSMLVDIGSVNYLSGVVTFPAKTTWIMCAWNIHILWTTISTHGNEMEKWNATRNCGNKFNYYLTFCVIFICI